MLDDSSAHDWIDGLLATEENEVPAYVAIEELRIATTFPIRQVRFNSRDV